MLEKLREEFRLTLLKEQLAGANGGEWLCRYGPGSEAEVRPTFSRVWGDLHIVLDIHPGITAQPRGRLMNQDAAFLWVI